MIVFYLALYMEECMDGNHKKWNKDGPEKYSKPSKLGYLGYKIID